LQVRIIFITALDVLCFDGISFHFCYMTVLESMDLCICGLVWNVQTCLHYLQPGGAI